MRLLIDANILLDVLFDRKPFVQDSSLIWKLCEVRKAEGYVSALTFANIVYVMRKELDPETIGQVLEKLSFIFIFTDLTVPDLSNAAALKWKDFEDAVQSVTAGRIHADCIVTRNPKDFVQSEIKVLTPPEFLACFC